MSVTDWINQHNGQLIKSPHGIKGQCVSVASQYAVDNGWPELRGPTAIAIYNAGQPGYNKVPNTPAGFPQPGDFVFWGYNHVALVEHADKNNIFTFEQNDPIGSVAHRKTYNYRSVVGWFSHPGATPPASSGGTAKVVKAVANVRMQPNSESVITSVLTSGATFQYVNKVVGENVSGNNIWYHSTKGHYVHSSGITG